MLVLQGEAQTHSFAGKTVPTGDEERNYEAESSKLKAERPLWFKVQGVRYTDYYAGS